MPGRKKTDEPRTIPGVYPMPYKDKKGNLREYWHWQVHVDGKPEFHGAATQDKAAKARARRLAEVERGEAVREGKETYGAFLKDWLPKHVVLNDIAPTTLAAYEAAIRLYIEPALGDLR